VEEKESLKYAVNICDLYRFKDNFFLQLLILPVVQTGKTLQCEKSIDSIGLSIDCDDERAQAIIELIRKKFKRYELRCYCSRCGNSWKRV